MKEGPLNECFWVNQANELDEQKNIQKVEFLLIPT